MQWGGITRLRNNAFTLIELLAIIVILAIIAVITVPIILNIIENSRKGAATDSAYGYKDSINKYYVSELSNNNKLMLNGTYEVKANGVLNGNFGVTENAEDRTIPIDGTKPSSGKLHYTNNVLDGGCLVIGDYAVIFEGGNATSTTKGDCSGYAINVSNPSFTNFSGVFKETMDYFFNETSLPDGAYYWAQSNSTLSQACVRTSMNDTICINSDSYDCGTFSVDGNTVTCSNTGYVSQVISQLQKLGFSCERWNGNSNDNFSCSSESLDAVFNFFKDGSVQAGNYGGTSCEATADYIDCN